MFVFDVFVDARGAVVDRGEGVRVLPLLGRAFGLHVGEAIFGDVAMHGFPAQGQGTHPERKC